MVGYYTSDSLKHTAVILVSPDQNFSNRPQSFNKQASIILRHSLIFRQHVIEISAKKINRKNLG